MRHSLKTGWLDEEAQPHLDPTGTDNVLRFAGSGQRRPADDEHRPEVVEILGSLGRASDLIRRADTRAAEAEALARDLGERVAGAEDRARLAEERAEHLESRLHQADEGLRTSERRFMKLSAWQVEKITEAQSEIDEARLEGRRAQHRVAELERTLSEQNAAVQSIIQDAGDRIFAAETRAIEATRDYEALRDYIRVNFGG